MLILLLLSSLSFQNFNQALFPLLLPFVSWRWYPAMTQMCVGHLKLPDQADSHYRNVCRALAAEARDLSMFLRQISNGTQVSNSGITLVFTCKTKHHDWQELRKLSNSGSDPESPLDELRAVDWARLWMQLIHELRQGVKLKKVDYDGSNHRTEYELTPYEMLLDDIRSQRYKLKHVTVNSDIPQRVKKDAHALILEFIRSRPPLVPASRRKLAPTPPKQQSMYDKVCTQMIGVPWLIYDLSESCDDHDISWWIRSDSSIN